MNGKVKEGQNMIKVNGEEMEWHPGMTVKDILEAKKFIFPMIGVWINDKPIPPTNLRLPLLMTATTSRSST